MKPVSKEALKTRFDKYFNNIHRSKGKSSIQILVANEKHDFNYQFSSGDLNQPFHIASIGKVFTATLIMILAERNRLSLQDLIHNFFSEAELERLFIYKNTDYANKVTVEQLMEHTSGIGDYFEDSVTIGKKMSKLIITEPTKKWTPVELVDFTRERQMAVGVPGGVFHYSDTGYILLGQIIEKVTGKSFHENLKEEIFTPLGMKHSYLLFYSEPEETIKPFQDVWLNGTNVTSFQSISADWAGGGIISTPSDLLTFYKGFRAGKLFNKEKIQMMENCNRKFRAGIYYGVGMMEIRFEEFFFLLRGLPRVKGHIGILSTHMFYDPSTETYLIMNFGSSKLMVQSFKALIEIVTQMRRLEK